MVFVDISDSLFIFVSLCYRKVFQTAVIIMQSMMAVCYTGFLIGLWKHRVVRDLHTYQNSVVAVFIGSSSFLYLISMYISLCIDDDDDLLKHSD